MRPISLTMQAFGSYGKETVIDFTKPVQNLFLITGDTGAGKTTIFDAMVFALYGEASSDANVKNGVALQSQFADLSVEPFVRLTFEEKGEQYVVRRAPKRRRPAKRKGAKEQEDPERIELTLPDGSVYPERDVNEKIAQIVGLTKHQFTKIAMLAQGEFVNVLREATKDKKEIFRKLFGTKIFSDVIDELKNRLDSKKGENDTLLSVCKEHVTRVEVESADDETTARLRELRQAILGAKKWPAAEIEEFMKLLKGYCDRLETEEAKRETEYQTAKDANEAAGQAVARAENIITAYEQLEEAEKELKACQEDEENIKRDKELALRIEKAYEIKSVWELFDQAERNADQAEKELKSLIEKAPEDKRASERADAELAALHEERDISTRELAGLTERVNAALATFKELASAQTDLETKETTATGSASAAAKARGELEEFERQLEERRKKEKELEDAPAKLEAVKAESQKADALSDCVSEAENAQTALAKQRREVEKAEAELKDAHTQWSAANAAADGAFRVYLSAQAGLIADQLKDGEPCPVCGSCEHPAPCALAEENKGLTWEYVQSLRQTESERRGVASQKSERCAVAKNLLKERESAVATQIDNLRAAVGACLPNLADKDYTIDDVKAACQEWKTEIGKKESDLTDECSQLTEIRKSYEGVDGRRIELKSAVDGADEESKRANGQLIAARAKVEELKKRQNEFASEQAAKEALELVKFANADVEKRYQEALAKSTAAKQTLSETNAKIDGIKETRKPKLEKEREERRKNYQKALAEKGILEETWKRAVGEYAKEKAQELRDSVDKRAQKRALAQGRRDAAKSVIGDNPRPNIEELRERQRVAEEASAAAEKRRQAASNLAGGNASAYAMLVKKMEERGSLSEEYSRIESLYTKLSGKTTGAGKSTGERMDVETFVQRYYLGMALYSANKRFSKMSGGQYELRLRKLDQQSGGAKDRGLDLMVYSNVTGKSREASTLSGGESFIAALALAMGMADQIQEKSSAINLDVMFIDEGFGSLDDHSRAQAVGALKQIADGSKLIGVISHVNELKREIDSQLVVTKGTDGSHAEWRLC